MAHGDAREGKWRGNCRMEWVASTLHTTSEHGESSITTADAHISAASSRLSWRPRRFKCTRPFRRKTKPVFCACATTFQLASTRQYIVALPYNQRTLNLTDCRRKQPCSYFDLTLKPITPPTLMGWRTASYKILTTADLWDEIWTPDLPQTRHWCPIDRGIR